MRHLIFLSGMVVPCCYPEPSNPEPSSCEIACEHWEMLGCDIAEPDEDGASCETICVETQEGGLIDLEPENATSLDACP